MAASVSGLLAAARIEHALMTVSISSELNGE
jgi:hypothetical protein